MNEHYHVPLSAAYLDKMGIAVVARGMRSGTLCSTTQFLEWNGAKRTVNAVSSAIAVVRHTLHKGFPGAKPQAYSRNSDRLNSRYSHRAPWIILTSHLLQDSTHLRKPRQG